MILQSGKTTVVYDLDEKFVIGCDEEQYDIIMNPGNVQRNEPHDALSIIAKTDKTLKIAIIIRHDKDAVFGGTLYENELTVTFGNDAMTINVENGELIRYEKDAVKEDFDYKFLDELLQQNKGII